MTQTQHNDREEDKYRICVIVIPKGTGKVTKTYKIVPTHTLGHMEPIPKVAYTQRKEGPVTKSISFYPKSVSRFTLMSKLSPI